MTFRKLARWTGLVTMPAVIATAMIVATTILSGQQAPGTIFRTQTNFVSTTVIARDKDGRFVPDLKVSDFTVLEDGVPQKIERFVKTIGGRAYTEMAAETPGLRAGNSEGLILPRTRQSNDASGRIFIILIDDLHLQVSDTPRAKQALMEIRDTLVHENDLVGFVSTGPSGIEINPTYDFGHKRFDEAIAKTMGAGMKINEILDQVKYEGEKSGPNGLRYAAHTAFKTAYDMIEELGKINDRRKSFIYLSSGYTFDPFRNGRYAQIKMRYQEAADTPTETVDPETGLDINRPIRSPYDVDTPLADQYYMQKTEFAESELLFEIAHLTRVAKKNNVVFYPLDPRGLTAAIPIEVRGLQTPDDWRDYIRTQGDSLRVLAEETGGFCICQTNDYKPGLKRIDAETSDYYLIGYTSTNPDPFKVKRNVSITLKNRPDVASPLLYRGEYVIEKPKRNAPPATSASR